MDGNRSSYYLSPHSRSCGFNRFTALLPVVWPGCRVNTQWTLSDWLDILHGGGNCQWGHQ